MQLRRLDPLANAGPYQRLLRNPVKSFSLSEAQYDRVKSARPDLVVTEGESAVVGMILADTLEVNYAYPDIEAFVDLFPEMLDVLLSSTTKDQAPRGLSIAFRDRPNRMTADTVFWSVALDQGEQWVEMNLVSVPEQPEPSNDLGDFEVLEASSDHDIAAIESAVTGRPPLSAAGVASLRENSKALRLARPKSGGEAIALLSLRTEPGGWGVLDQVLVGQEASAVRGPLTAWAAAWLRNNGARRMRRRINVDDTAEIAALRDLGFTPGEAGLYLTRSVDAAEVAAKLEERKSHGTLIKFGDWR